MCTRCVGCDASMITDQEVAICGMCQQLKPPAPPPMRRPDLSLTSNLDPMWIVLVFVAGLAVGSKMVGGW